MILFWVICGAMLFVALFFVLPPALRSDAGKSKDDNARRDANVAVYRDQLKELEADRRNGIVSEEQYAQDRDDIELDCLVVTLNLVIKLGGFDLRFEILRLVARFFDLGGHLFAHGGRVHAALPALTADWRVIGG